MIFDQSSLKFAQKLRTPRQQQEHLMQQQQQMEQIDHQLHSQQMPSLQSQASLFGLLVWFLLEICLFGLFGPLAQMICSNSCKQLARRCTLPWRICRCKRHHTWLLGRTTYLKNILKNLLKLVYLFLGCTLTMWQVLSTRHIIHVQPKFLGFVGPGNFLRWWPQVRAGNPACPPTPPVCNLTGDVECNRWHCMTSFQHLTGDRWCCMTSFQHLTGDRWCCMTSFEHVTGDRWCCMTSFEHVTGEADPDKKRCSCCQSHNVRVMVSTVNCLLSPVTANVSCQVGFARRCHHWPLPWEDEAVDCPSLDNINGARAPKA